MSPTELETIADRLRELDPSDDYHRGAVLDDRTYYAALDRAIAIVTGELADWKDGGAS